MKIIDTINNKVGLGSESYLDTVGIVFKTQKMLDDRPLLGLIIPKFMLGYDYKEGDQPKEESIKITKKKCLNDDKDSLFDNSLMIKNYILVRPLLNQNQSLPIYTQGDKVIVKIIDNDIKTLAFYPYSINRLGQRGEDKLFMSVPASGKENTDVTESNSYFLKIDSIEKLTVLHTTKENGETAALTLALNAGDGVITITDNEERSWTMDTKNDSITSVTSGTTIEQIGNTINYDATIHNIRAKSEINIETKLLNIDANTINSKGKDVNTDYKRYKQQTMNGEWKINSVKWDGMSFSSKYMTYHNDTPLIGLNGQVVFPNFVIGAIPNINVPVPPTSGSSGPPGAMVFRSDPAAVPLVKFPVLMGILAGMAASIDAKSGAPSATSAMVAAMGPQLPAIKTMSS